MKKVLKLLLSLIMVIGISVSFSLTASANLSDMSVIEEDSTAYEFLNIRLIESKCLDPIKSFDVNEKGFVVIATSNKSIVVIDDNNEQISAFSFETYGDYFVKWNGENILLFLVRGNDIVQMNMNGDFISGLTVDIDDWDTYQIWCELSKTQNVVMNNNEYRLKSSNAVFKIFNSLYSTIEKVDANGSIVTVYDVTEKYNGMAFLFCVFIVVMLMCAMYLFVKLYHGNKAHGNRKNQWTFHD